jgi:diguanylate cyclase (GGDEF)-like protein
MAYIPNSVLDSAVFTDFLFNNLTSAIFLSDSEFRVRKVNDTYRSLFAKEEVEVLDQICGNSLGCQFAVEQDKPCGTTSECGNCPIRNCLVKTFKNTDAIENAYIERSFYIDNKPVKKYFRMKFRHVLWGNEQMAIVAIDDITELQEQRKKLEDLANQDFLTNLNNRRHFFELAENLFENAKRGSIGVSVAMFDIDFFKRINDANGHAAGDFVIKSVADILQQNLRKSDILARFGGEEFCLLLHCKEIDDAYTVVDKLRLMVELHAFVHEGKRIPVTISAGLTSKLEDSLDVMIQKADEMLYKAKAGGRNRTEEYAG